MSDRINDGRRADLKDGGGTRRDYGPKGACGPIVYGAAAVATALIALVRAGRR